MSKKPYDYQTKAANAVDYDRTHAVTSLRFTRVLRKLVRDSVLRTPSMMAHGLTREETARRLAKELVP